MYKIELLNTVTQLYDNNGFRRVTFNVEVVVGEGFVISSPASYSIFTWMG